MRDLNEDSNSCGWPLFYGDTTFMNGQCYNGFLPRTVVDVCSVYGKDEVKRTMLEHEAIFKNQLCELHRLYRIQRDLMGEARRQEINKNRMPVETSLSSSPLASQIRSEDARRWHIPGFPLGNSICVGPSTSGIEDTHSPLSSMKGSSVQASPLLSQNAGPPKDTEVLESRPSKVRRKMFDLHLPADEYVDTEVENVLAESCLKRKSNLADLNEPIEVEDTNTPSNEIEELELGAKPQSQFLGFPRGVLPKSHRETSNGALHDSYLQNNGNKKSWFPNSVDSGHSKNNLLSVTQDFQTGKMPSSSEKIQVLLNKGNEPATLFLTNQNRADQLREKTVQGSANSHPISAVTSNTRVDHSSDMSKTWSHATSSWDKLNGRSCHSSTQSHGVFVNRWNYNANCTSNVRTPSNLSNKNGFHHGFSSGSDELLLSSAGNVAPEHFINQNPVKLYNNSNCRELNLNSGSSTNKASQRYLEVIDLERNHGDDVVTLPWLRTKPNCKNETCYRGVDLNADMNSLNLSSDSSEGGKVILQNTKSASCAEGSTIGAVNCRKILGFPIFVNQHSSQTKSPSVVHPQCSEVVEFNSKNRVLDINLPCDQDVMPLEKETGCVRHQIDLNSCITEDEACLTPSVTAANVKAISGIDLEAPAVPEEEDDIVPTQECIETANDNLPDECIRTAAEAIVAISLSGKDIHRAEASSTDPLQWFVDLVLENKYATLGDENFQYNNWYNCFGYTSEDYFESMTLRLRETKEEDYMPKPLVPENLILPEASTSLLTTRPRRGQARRGRQRKDFQRDILPGITSLSRPEVTEDLQTFGEMMRATGHLWHSALNRRNSTRNGCGRGRRRSVVNAPPAAPPPSPPPPPLIEQLNNVEVGLEDRNLRGWGKTTRRPRRQRCPPGNPTALPLT